MASVQNLEGRMQRVEAQLAALLANDHVRRALQGSNVTPLKPGAVIEGAVIQDSTISGGSISGAQVF
jgi:hypothetical protein